MHFDASRKVIRKFLIPICILILATMLLLALSVISGPIFAALYPYCDAQVFGSKEATAINVTIPDLRHLSQKESVSLLVGTYKLSNKYTLKLEQDAWGLYRLCLMKRYHTTVSACFEISTDLEQVVICSPDMRPDCLPSAIVQHYFGTSLWYQDKSTVIYLILDIDSSAKVDAFVINNTTTSLSSLWYDSLECQSYLHLQVVVIVTGTLGFFFCCGFSICCLGGPCGYCLWVCNRCRKQKR